MFTTNSFPSPFSARKSAIQLKHTFQSVEMFFANQLYFKIKIDPRDMHILENLNICCDDEEETFLIGVATELKLCRPMRPLQETPKQLVVSEDNHEMLVSEGNAEVKNDSDLDDDDDNLVSESDIRTTKTLLGDIPMSDKDICIALLYTYYALTLGEQTEDIMLPSMYAQFADDPAAVTNLHLEIATGNIMCKGVDLSSKIRRMFLLGKMGGKNKNKNKNKSKSKNKNKKSKRNGKSKSKKNKQSKRKCKGKNKSKRK